MRVSLWNLVEDVWMKVDIFHSHMQCKYKVTRTVFTVWGAGIWSCEVTPMVKVYFVTNRHICWLLVGWQLNISWTTVHEHFTISWSLCTSHLKPHPRHARGKAGTITSYSPACVSLGGGVNTHFDFFVVWFSDCSKSSRARSEQTTSSHLKIKLTSLQMNGGFTFNLSVVAVSRHLVI